MSENSVHEKIAKQVSENPILLYVKGTPDAPRCGFSKVTMDIFSELGASYKTVDVLAEPEYRDAVKEFTQWPTIPQVFIKGEFVGGCDIVQDLYQSGELKKMVEKANA